MTVRLKAIILQRKASADESLFIETLLENGEFGSFKIPGILKSAKRSSFHFAPGGIYQFVFPGAVRPDGLLGTGRGAAQRLIPKSYDLVFSPYEHSQDYKLLGAVAEIVQLAEFVKSAPENNELFPIIANALSEVAASDPQDAEKALDAFYWKFLQFLGLAGENEPGGEYVGYDLASGYLTARELAERPRTDSLLPAAWIHGEGDVDSAACREVIRRYLRSI